MPTPMFPTLLLEYIRIIPMYNVYIYISLLSDWNGRSLSLSFLTHSLTSLSFPRTESSYYCKLHLLIITQDICCTLRTRIRGWKRWTRALEWVFKGFGLLFFSTFTLLLESYSRNIAEIWNFSLKFFTQKRRFDFFVDPLEESNVI